MQDTTVTHVSVLYNFVQHDCSTIIDDLFVIFVTLLLQSVFTPKNLADAYIPLQPAPTDNLVKNLPKFDGTTHNKEFFKYALHFTH